MPDTNYGALAYDALDYDNGYALLEKFENKPGIAADVSQVSDVGTALAIMAKANRAFALAGTNATTSNCAFSPKGGITLTTGTTSGDQVLLVPHPTAGQSGWATAGLWTTNKALKYATRIATGATIVTVSIFAGLKKTNTPVIATDDDQVYFRYDPAESANWQLVISRAGVDTVINTGVPVAANTEYSLRIETDANRRVQAWINGNAVSGGPFAALTDAVNLFPFAGIQTNSGAAKSVDVRYEFARRAA